MLLNKIELPEWFDYPSDFLTVVDQGLVNFDPWIILTNERLRLRFEGIKERYPNRNLIPFARREDNDDLACFEKDNRVVIIHDFASSGWEGGGNSIIFWDWLRMVIEDMIDYNS